MDIIITAVGEFVWAASCAVVNFCLSSGLSVLTVFISLLCAILASAFYKYTTSREQMSTDDNTYTLANQENDNLDKPIIFTSIIEPSITSTTTATNESNNIETIESISEIEITFEEDRHENGIEHEENTIESEENHEETTNDILIETIEGTEEEIQKQQIANIYRLLNDQHLTNNWTTTDFLDQLKMYGLQAYDENELELS